MSDNQRTELREVFFSSPALRAVLLTDFLVLLAELGAVVILPWWITGRGGAGAIVAFGIALAVATFIVMPAVSPFGDRICKGRQITRGIGGLCVVTGAQAALSFAGFFSITTLMALGVLQVLAASFVNPARDAVLAELISPAQLPAAIRLRKTTQAVSGILGPLWAGAAVAAWGISGALVLQGGLLAVAMVCASGIPRSAAPQPLPPREALARWWTDLRAGLAAKWRVPMERGWTMVNFAVWIFQGPAVGLLIPLKVHALGLDGRWLGLGLGALSLGVLLGSLFVRSGSSTAWAASACASAWASLKASRWRPSGSPRHQRCCSLASRSRVSATPRWPWSAPPTAHWPFRANTACACSPPAR